MFSSLKISKLQKPLKIYHCRPAVQLLISIHLNLGVHDDGVFDECKVSDQEFDDDIASINSKDNYDDADDDVD